MSQHVRSKFHGERTNKDYAKLVEKRDKRRGIPLAPVSKRKKS